MIETNALGPSARGSGRQSNFSISGKLMSTCGAPVSRRASISCGRRCNVCGPNTRSTYGARLTIASPSWDATHPPTPISTRGLACFSSFQRPSCENTFSCAFSRIEQVFTRITSASASFVVSSSPCASASTSAMRELSYSFIWQPWVLMNNLPDMVYRNEAGFTSLKPQAHAVSRFCGTRHKKAAWHHIRAGANFLAMKTAVNHGETGGRCARSVATQIPFPMRAVWVLALLVCAAYALPGHAAALYQCSGAQGETVFTSHPSEYHGCKWVSGPRHSSPKPAAARPDEAKAVPASLVRTSSTPMQSSRPVQKEVKANPAVIQITPLQAPSAPVVSPLPSEQGVVPISKP